MDKRSKIVKALMNLGHTNWTLYCDNLDDIDTREKFNAAFRKTMYEAHSCECLCGCYEA